jgi:hypothetical protein
VLGPASLAPCWLRLVGGSWCGTAGRCRSCSSTGRRCSRRGHHPDDPRPWTVSGRPQRRPGRQRQLLDDQSGRLTLQLGKHTRHLRRAQDLSERVSLLIGHRNTVRPHTFLVVHGEIAPPATIGDNTKAAPLPEDQSPGHTQCTATSETTVAAAVRPRASDRLDDPVWRLRLVWCPLQSTPPSPKDFAPPRPPHRHDANHRHLSPPSH